jgi:AraC-like DNA-binding protein
MSTAAPSRAAPSAPSIEVRRLDPATAALHAGPHGHDHHVLVLVEGGDGSLVLGEQPFDARPGDLFVVPPGEVHDATGLATASGWMLSFDEAVVEAPLVPRTGGRSRIAPDRLARWCDRVGQLELELAERPTGYPQATRALLSLILVDIVRVESRHVVDPHPVAPVVAEVFDVIDRRYTEKLSLDAVARAVARSPGHLTRVVKEMTGQTVVHWIEHRKMVEARRLLLETELKVEAIAGRLGFADPSHFRRRFRHVHGMPPAAWRQTNG